jgi:hypothetical protein
MKYLIRLFGATLFVPFALTSCGDSSNSNEKVTQEKKQDQKTNDQIEKLKADSIESITWVIGNYSSVQGYRVEYAEGTEVDGSRVTLSIHKDKNKDNTIFAEYIYTGDQPNGCSGIHTTAKAEVLRIEKIDNDIFKLYMMKTSCDYTENEGCDAIEFLENKPKTDNEFHLTINLKNEITIESTSLKSKCKKAWDFTKLTFQRLPII